VEPGRQTGTAGAGSGEPGPAGAGSVGAGSAGAGAAGAGANGGGAADDGAPGLVSKDLPAGFGGRGRLLGRRGKKK